MAQISMPSCLIRGGIRPWVTGAGGRRCLGEAVLSYGDLRDNPVMSGQGGEPPKLLTVPINSALSSVVLAWEVTRVDLISSIELSVTQ